MNCADATLEEMKIYIGFESPFICRSSAHPRKATWHQLGFSGVNGEVNI